MSYYGNWGGVGECSEKRTQLAPKPGGVRGAQISLV